MRACVWWVCLPRSLTLLVAADATDPGGRLGPADYQRPVVPDLRNLQLVFAYLEPGDAVVLMSDGVHDNLDPVFLGEWVRRIACVQAVYVRCVCSETTLYMRGGHCV